MTKCDQCGRVLPPGIVRCSCAVASAVKKSSATLSKSNAKPTPPNSMPTARVLRGNRKLCSACGADVTFGKRKDLGAGLWMCFACDSGGAPALLEDIDLKGTPASAPVLQSDSHTKSKAASSQSVRSAVPAPAPPPPSGRRLAIWLITATSLAVVAVIAVILWPSWEDKHRDQILAMKASADAARLKSQTRPAYDAYVELIKLTDGHRISSGVLQGEIESAKTARDLLLPKVQAELDREQRELAARQEAARQEQLAREAAAREEAQRMAAREAARLEAGRLQKAAIAAKERQIQRLATIRGSDEFKSIVTDAHETRSQTDIALIGEDSAYRAMSAMSETNVTLLELFVKEEALLDGLNVGVKLKVIDRSLSTDMSGETSAIRAVYKKDKAFLKVLGVYADVLDSRLNKGQRTLRRAIDTIQTEAATSTATDDSAPRAVSAYGEASLKGLNAISGAMDIDTSSIVMDAARDNIRNTTAWQVADRNAEAQALIVLEWLKPSNPAKAASIVQDMRLADIGEDSALRSAYKKKKAISDALVILIER